MNHPFKPVLLDLLHQAQSSQNAFFRQLPQAELMASGTPDYWSAKDHVAHLTFWQERLALRVQAILQREPQPPVVDFEQLNPVIFERHQHRSWPDILLESDAVYAQLLMLTDQLAEEDLTAFNRFDWTHEGAPLYSAFMGNCYEHTQQHLAQYALDRHDLELAITIYETWASRVIEAEAPEPLKGYILYNLACFYATHSRREQAWSALQQAFTLYPATREFALTDSDLVTLRSYFSD